MTSEVNMAGIKGMKKKKIKSINDRFENSITAIPDL